MQITILSVSVEHMPGKNGGYDKAEVAYKDGEGKVSGKNIVSFNAPDAFAVIKAATNGDVLEVTPEKDAKGYWQWVKAVKLDAAQAAAAAAQPSADAGSHKSTGGTASPRSTYETPEERVVKQRYIVRQSAINAAIATLASPDGIVVDDVLQIAKEYEKFVYRDDEVKSDGFTDFKDDADKVF